MNSNIQTLAQESDVQIYSFNVIYKMMDHLWEQLDSRLPPVEEEEITGKIIKTIFLNKENTCRVHFLASAAIVDM